MASSSSRNRPGLTYYFGLALLIFTFISVGLNVWHSNSLTNDKLSFLQGIRSQDWKVSANFAESFAKEQTKQQPQQQVAAKDKGVGDSKKDVTAPPLDQDIAMDMGHRLAGLDCSAYGGPSKDIAREMVYWQDIPSDTQHISPFKRKDVVQYMTFEPDSGGWNNIRMAMETVLALAIAMGRTLVLPPNQRYYLIDKNIDKVETFFSFANFFHMESIAQEHLGLEIITMTEFLEQHAMTGRMVDVHTGKVSFPPNNRTNWDGERKHIINAELNMWLRNVTHVTLWSPDHCVATFPTSADPKELERLKQMKEKMRGEGVQRERFVGRPTPADAPSEQRMRESWAGRDYLCLYDEELQKAPVVHFAHDNEMHGGRLLVHFYAFLFFEDWKQDLWMKRFVRDHVRYIDEIQCAAARVVHALRERAKSRNPENTEGAYDSFHVRRGDFQFKQTRVEADVIYNSTKKELTEGATVFMATDESNKTFFQPLVRHYDLVYLDDFADLLKDVNTNYYGMLDQLIASRGRKFFGCYYSTFTGYINRMRGYHVDTSKLAGYENGTLLNSYYYAPEDAKYTEHIYAPISQPFFAREFPTSWFRIDKGIGEMQM